MQAPPLSEAELMALLDSLDDPVVLAPPPPAPAQLQVHAAVQATIMANAEPPPSVKQRKRKAMTVTVTEATREATGTKGKDKDTDKKTQVKHANKALIIPIVALAVAWAQPPPSSLSGLKRQRHGHLPTFLFPHRPADLPQDLVDTFAMALATVPNPLAMAFLDRTTTRLISLAATFSVQEDQRASGLRKVGGFIVQGLFRSPSLVVPVAKRLCAELPWGHAVAVACGMLFQDDLLLNAQGQAQVAAEVHYHVAVLCHGVLHRSDAPRLAVRPFIQAVLHLRVAVYRRRLGSRNSGSPQPNPNPSVPLSLTWLVRSLMDMDMDMDTGMDTGMGMGMAGR